jgi:hypothetical protein
LLAFLALLDRPLEGGAIAVANAVPQDLQQLQLLVVELLELRVQRLVVAGGLERVEIGDQARRQRIGLLVEGRRRCDAEGRGFESLQPLPRKARYGGPFVILGPCMQLLHCRLLSRDR